MEGRAARREAAGGGGQLARDMVAVADPRSRDPVAVAGPLARDLVAVAGPLARDLLLLERIADAEADGEPGVGVSALADIVGRDKSQVSRALARLADAGMLERSAASRRYRLGPRVFALASRAASGRLLAAAGEPMRALSRDLGETVHLVVLAGPEIVTLRTESPHGYRAAGWVGRRAPAHSTSAGRALLIDASPAEIERRFAEVSFAAAGPRASVHVVGDLVEAVASASASGFAAVDEEFEAGVAGVSAPIRDFRGAVVAALNVSAPAERLRGCLAAAGERTRTAADTISQQLGWAGVPGTPLGGPS